MGIQTLQFCNRFLYYWHYSSEPELDNPSIQGTSLSLLSSTFFSLPPQSVENLLFSLHFKSFHYFSHWPILFSSELYQSISTWICKTVLKSIFNSLFMFSVRTFNQFFHIMHETLHIVRLSLNTSRYIHSSKQQFTFWSQSSLKISS